MHRIPKIFVIHKKGGRGSGSGDRSGGRMNSKVTSPAGGSTKPRPRLERRNASKNIDYELPSTSSFSSEDSLSSSSSSSGAAAGAQRTRSLDIYPLDKQTSFRIGGKEGEFEFLCKSLGFSGIEDFGIPTEEWEALKVRSSSDVLPRLSRFGNSGPVSSSRIKPKIGGDDYEVALKDISAACPKVIDEAIVPEIEGFDRECTDSSTASPRVADVIGRKIELNHSRFSDVATISATSTRSSDVSSQKIEVNGFGFSDTVAIRSGNGSLSSVNDIIGGDVVCRLPDRSGNSVRVSDAFSNKSEGVKVIGCNGIKGMRPPALAPPPAMSLPVIDSACSTWDILKAFAPEDGRFLSRFEPCEAVSSEDEDRGTRDEEEEHEVHCVVTGRRIGGENGLLSESCSFTTTSNDDDSSSTTTEPMSNISPNGRFRLIIKPWEKGGLLGRGSFGSVYEGIASDGFFFAVKEVSLLDQGEEGRQSLYQLEQEIALLSQFEHENIVQYYGTDKDESKLYIFLELVTQGSLMSLYQKYHLKDYHVSGYTRQILNGLKYLHDRDVVHRDIKCANILVAATGSVKLADFGLAKAAKLNDVKSCKGTAFWMAPEVVNRRNQGYGRAADIWSLGCTVLEMLTGQFPYSDLECMQALFRIGRGVPPAVPESLPRDARDFILQCLQVNPNSRPSAAQLLDHPFVQRSLPSSGSASPYHPARRF